MTVELNEREVEVLVFAARGKTARETGLELHYGYETIKDRLLAAREKLGARNTTEAVAIAIRRGLLDEAVP